jgi:hypothetical protein
MNNDTTKLNAFGGNAISDETVSTAEKFLSMIVGSPQYLSFNDDTVVFDWIYEKRWTTIKINKSTIEVSSFVR